LSCWAKALKLVAKVIASRQIINFLIFESPYREF
jgi:hypothetical protein